MTAVAHPSSTVGRVFEHRWVQYRRTFRSTIFTSFLTPVLFLTAMGLGLGSYVSDSAIDAMGGVSYLVFLAPGLLAATAMQSAAFEATFPIMGGLVWNRVFHAMFATPISGRDIALGNLAWIAARLTLIATIFTLVIVLFGAAESPLVVLAIPAAVLTGKVRAEKIAIYAGELPLPLVDPGKNCLLARVGRNVDIHIHPFSRAVDRAHVDVQPTSRRLHGFDPALRR